MEHGLKDTYSTLQSCQNFPAGSRQAAGRARICETSLFPYVSIRAPYGTLGGHALAPNWSRSIWKTLKIPMRGPYDAHTGIAWGTCGVLRIFQPNHNDTAMSSHTGPTAWYDHENSTDVKLLQMLHSALPARNRMGDKNCTGPVVGCDRHNWACASIHLSKTKDWLILLGLYTGRTITQRMLRRKRSFLWQLKLTQFKMPHSLNIGLIHWI